MKKISLLFLVGSTFVSNTSLALDCIDQRNSEQIYNNIFRDETTLAVYCEATSEKIETCMVFNEPNLVVSFKKIKTIDNDNKFLLCDFNAVNISDGNVLYKRENRENRNT